MTYDSSKSLLLQLRDAAKIERDTLTRFKMKTVADDLDLAMKAFRDGPNGVALSTMVGLWARGVRELGFASAPLPEGGGSKIALAA